MVSLNLSYGEIIKLLETRYDGLPDVKTYKGLELADEFVIDYDEAVKKEKRFFIDPKLPIDFVMVKNLPELDHETRRTKRISFYTLFWIVSSAGIPLEKKLSFYQFYLSRIAEPRAVRIVMLIPYSDKKRLEKALMKIADENGFGLWIIDNNKTIKELRPPQNFLEYIEGKFVHPSKDMQSFPKYVTKWAPKISLFFDRYILDAVDAVAGLMPDDVGKRYIEREVLELVLQLKNGSYAPRLVEAVREHLVKKGNDFDFVAKTFNSFWKDEFGKMYSNFLKVSEAPLFNIVPKRGKAYRDHYLHQFQVFLLGLYIIDNLRNRFDSDIDKKWLITASFHDMAYPIQLYDTWAKKFFNKSLGIPEMGALDIRSFFVDKSLLVRLGFIINALCKKHFRDARDDLQGNWLHGERDLVMFFHEKITKAKHHCILSSMYLLKEAQLCPPEFLESLFVPSALAIAIHHPNVIFNKDDKAFQKLRPERKLKSLKFDRDPLSFLLMFCDCAQEWGRPTSKQPMQKIEEEEQEQWFVFKKCFIDKDKTECSVIIETPRLYESDKRFKVKAEELCALGKFLESPPGLEFKIVLQDRSEKQIPFTMRGPS